MKLLRLYIHNCGVFKNTLIDFTHNGEPQNIICLAGVNGSGKTTIMELILNLISFINPNLQNVLFDRLKPHVLTRTEFAQLDVLIENKVLSLVLGDKSNIQINPYRGKPQGFIIENEIKVIIKNIEDTIVKRPEDEKKETLDVIKRVESYQKAELFHKRKIETQEILAFEEIRQKIGTFSLQDKITPDILLEMPSVYFLNAYDREIQDIRYSFIPQEKQKYEIAHSYHPNKDDLKKKLIYYDYAHSQQFEDLKKWVNQYILVDKSLEKIDRPNFQVIIRTKNGEKQGLELLSSGEESLLIIATQLYLKASKNVIFLIDEIDQSLHPEFQQQAIKLLNQLQKEKGCQIIVSSHSRVIWNTFPERGLINLTKMVM